MELPQLLLLLAIVILTIILTIIGIQIIIMLKESRETLRKADHIVDNLDFLTGSLVRTSSTFSHLSSSLESGMQLVGLVSKLVSSKSKK